MYVLVTCDRPGCSKLHRVIAARSARQLGADALPGPHRSNPVARDRVTVSLPLDDGLWGGQSHIVPPAGVRPAR
jgi:hypothetical protein